MKETILAPVKKPAIVALLSATCCAAIVFAWLRFPSRVPVTVLILVGTITAVTAIVTEAMVLLRLIRTAELRQRPPGEIHNLLKRAVIAFVLLFVSGNAFLLSFPGLSILEISAANLAFILSWFIAWRLIARIRK